MIASEDIERAETVLRVVYGLGMEQQLEHVKVERESFDNFLKGIIALVKQRYGTAWAEMDPRLEPAIATMFGHAFLVGIVAGRNSERQIL